MLEKLDDISWKELRHAYGSAEDVPGQIRNLLSPDQKTRKQARWQLYGNIFHQGSRYEASPYAVPFLYELIQSEDTPERVELILMLVHLALGYEESFLPEGLDISTYRQSLKKAEEQLSEEQRKENLLYGHSLSALIDVYDEVKKGLPILYKLLDHADVEIAKVASYVLAWFPEEASTSISQILRKVPGIEDELHLCAAILSLGMLERTSDEKSNLDYRAYLNDDSLFVSTAAAIALAKKPLEPDVLQVLIKSLSQKKELEGRDVSYFNDGDLPGYLSLVLATYGAAEKEKILPILCDTLASVNAYESLDITQSMLMILNENREVSIGKEAVEKLTTLEKKC